MLEKQHVDPRMRLLLSRSPGGVKARETPQAAENGLSPVAPRPGSEGGASGLLPSASSAAGTPQDWPKWAHRGTGSKTPRFSMNHHFRN